jgi:hypothetical protein
LSAPSRIRTYGLLLRRETDDGSEDAGEGGVPAYREVDGVGRRVDEGDRDRDEAVDDPEEDPLELRAPKSLAASDLLTRRTGSGEEENLTNVR